MATRTISTKLAIEGESEYRAKIAQVNTELKSLQSSLKLTKSQYQINANTMEALSAKNKALSDLFAAQKDKIDLLKAALNNAREAEQKYAQQKAELIAKIKANDEALERLRNTAGDTSEEEARLTAENQKLVEELDRCNGNLAAASKGINGWQSDLNKAQVELNDLDAELKLNNEYMDEAKKSTDGCATSIDRFGKQTKGSTDAIDTLAQALGAAGLSRAISDIREALEVCVASAVEFESAMAGVAKTTDMTESELGDMGDAIQDLSTRIPAAATEIAGVAEAAGQLGIAKEDILAFSEVMVNLGVATNLSSEEAATALAKFANVVGMSTDNYERLGSTIVDLGNNFATTEADIVSMATRLSSTGAIIGLTEPQIMAIATALSSVGIEAEAGGTAISKLLKQFETMVATGSEDLSSFASVAGMSAQEFSQAWGENAVGALAAFIDGLAEIDDAGGSSVAVLNELGITESRMSTAVQSLAASHGILNRALSTADQAWKNNSALMREAATRYQTTESRVQMCKNALEGLKVTVGKQLTPALGNIADAGKNAMKVASDFVETNRWLVPTITGLTSALSVGAAALAGYTAITKLAIPAITAFNTALAANPWGAVALGAAAAITAITTLVITLKDDAIPTVDELTDAAQALPEAFDGANSTLEENSTSIQATAAVVSDYIDRLSELESQGLTTAAAQEEYRQIPDQIRYLLPDISLELDVQTGKIIGGSAALRDYVENWKEAAVQQALIDNYQAKIKAYSDAEVEAATNTARLTFALAEEKSIKEQIAAVTDQMSKYQAKNNAILEDSTLTAIEADKARQQLNLEYTEQAMRLKELQDKLKDNQQEQERLNEAAAVSAENMSAFTAEVDLAKEAVTQYNATLGSSSGVTAENASVVAAIKGELTGLAQSYKEAYDAATSSIEGQIGLFDTFAVEISADTDTVEEMMARWGEQTENLAKYTEDLKKAAQYGLDDGLIQSLSDGSASSAGYLSTIIAEIERLGGTTEGMSGEASAFVDEFNAAFERTGEAKESFAATVAAIQTDLEAAVAGLEETAQSVDFSGFNDALQAAFANVGVDFQEIGVNAGTGLALGMQDTSKDVSAAATKVAEDSNDALKSAYAQKSPSRIWRDIGQNNDAGLALGIKDNAGKVVSEAKSLADRTTSELKSGASRAVKAFDGEFSQITSRTASRLSSLQSTISSATSGLPGTMNSVGIQMINGMISGLNSRSSALYATVRSIVNQAIDAAKKAAAVRSPSKKTTEIFEQVGEGMVVGLENKREKVSETAQSVVNDALKLELEMPEIPKIDDRMPRIEFPQQTDPQRIAELSRSLNGIERQLKVLQKSVDDGKELYLDGDKLVGGTIGKIGHELHRAQQKNSRGKGIT